MKNFLQCFVVTLCIFVCGSVSHAAMPTEWTANFDGVDDYVDIGDSEALGLTGDGTVSTWLYVPSVWTGDQYPNIISKGASAGWDTDGWSLFGFNNYLIGIGMRNGVPTSQCSYTTTSKDQWIHVLGTWDGTDVKLYENGILKKSCNQTISPASNSTSVLIGKGGSYEWGGGIEDVRIYNRALSATEVANLYEGESVNSGLVAHYPFSEGAGTTVYDSSPMWLSSNSATAPYQLSGAEARLTIIDNVARVTDDVSAGDWRQKFLKIPVSDYIVGEKRRVTFEARASVNKSEGMYLRDDSNSSGNVIENNFGITTEWQSFSFDYNVNISPDDISIGAYWHLEQTGEWFEVRNLSTQKINDPVHGTLTNADTTSPGETGSFWQEGMAGGQNYKNGYSEGLLTKTGGTTYAVSPTAYGIWEFDVNKTESSSTRILFIASVIGDRAAVGQEGYYILLGTTEAIYFGKINNGSPSTIFGTASDFIEVGVNYRIKVIRNSVINEFHTGAVGSFSVYIKGGDFGDEYVLVDLTGGSGTNPVVDNTHTNSKYFVNNLYAGDQISNLKINKKSIPLHEFTAGTGTFDKISIPAQGRLDALGGEKGHEANAIQWEPPMEWVGEFDGVDDTIELGDIWKEESPYMELKFINTGKENAYRWIVNRRSGGGDFRDYQLIIMPDNKLGWGLLFDDGSYESIYSDTEIILNTEYSVKTWYDKVNTTLHLILNGVETTKFITDKPLTKDATSVFLGSANPWTSYNFPGKMWDVKLGRWDSTIEKAEITNQYLFSEGAGTTAFDSGDIYGPELVTNGEFSDGTNDWLMGQAGVDFSVANGNGQIAYNNTTVYGNIYQQVATVLDAEYELSLDVSQLSSAAVGQRVTIGSGFNGNSVLRKELSVGENILRFTADATNAYLAVKLEGGDETDLTPLIFDNVSLREIESPANGTITNGDVASPGESGSFWQERDDGETPNLENGYSSGIIAKTNGTHYFPSTQAYGTWEFDYYKSDINSRPMVQFMSDITQVDSDAGGHYLLFSNGGDRKIYLNRYFGGGVLWGTADNYIDLSTWYRLKITRNSITDEYITGAKGTIAVYIKGGSFGNDYVLIDTTGGSGTNPYTDNTYVTSSYVLLDLNVGDGIANFKIGGASVSTHDFIPGTGTANKLFIPARMGSSVVDALGWELERGSQKYFRTLSQLTSIQQVASAVSGVRYWVPVMRQFFLGQVDGMVSLQGQTSQKITTSARTTMHTNKTGVAGINYWDKELKKFFRGLSDGTLEEFKTWFGTQ